LEHLWRMDVGFPTYVVFVVLGLLNCLAGYKLFRALLGIWGFLGGATLALAFLQGTRFDPLLQLVAAVIAGIGGAILVTVLYSVGVFFFGAGFGLIVASALEPQFHIASTRVLEFVLAVVGGIAALALQRAAITLFTAFGGAWVAVTCVAALVASCPLATFPARCARAVPWAPVILGACVCLGLVGVAAQSRQSPGRRKRVWGSVHQREGSGR
jgi:hypothetical protein